MYLNIEECPLTLIIIDGREICVYESDECMCQSGSSACLVLCILLGQIGI